MVRIKRVYEPPAEDDGLRVLVDGLWPRGLTRQAAAVDLWLKEIAPSPALRRWFAHEPERWPAFKARYGEELRAPERAAALSRLRAAEREAGTVTLLYAAREQAFNHAVLLRDLLNQSPSRAPD